jgi:hypothetical protein
MRRRVPAPTATEGGRVNARLVRVQGRQRWLVDDQADVAAFTAERRALGDTREIWTETKLDSFAADRAGRVATQQRPGRRE